MFFIKNYIKSIRVRRISGGKDIESQWCFQEISFLFLLSFLEVCPLLTHHDTSAIFRTRCQSNYSCRDKIALRNCVRFSQHGLPWLAGIRHNDGKSETSRNLDCNDRSAQTNCLLIYLFTSLPRYSGRRSRHFQRRMLIVYRPTERF